MNAIYSLFIFSERNDLQCIGIKNARCVSIHHVHQLLLSNPISWINQATQNVNIFLSLAACTLFTPVAAHRMRANLHHPDIKTHEQTMHKDLRKWNGVAHCPGHRYKQTHNSLRTPKTHKRCPCERPVPPRQKVYVHTQQRCRAFKCCCCALSGGWMRESVCRQLTRASSLRMLEIFKRYLVIEPANNKYKIYTRRNCCAAAACACSLAAPGRSNELSKSLINWPDNGPSWWSRKHQFASLQQSHFLYCAVWHTRVASKLNFSIVKKKLTNDRLDSPWGGVVTIYLAH